MGLFLIFLFNLGLPQFIINNPSPKKETVVKDNYREEAQEISKKYDRAQKLGVQYSPEEYFQDLADLELLERGNTVDYRNRILISGVRDNLCYLFNENVQNKRSQADFELYMNRLEQAQQAYFIKVDGHSPESKKIDFQENVWSILFWLLKLYLKNLPLGLILLFIWWYQENKTWKVNDWWSFLFSVLIYPVLIVRSFKEDLRYQTRFVLLSAEYRRRAKDLFARFSAQETAELRQIAQSKISLKDYRHSLQVKNLTVRWALAPALIITLLFLCLPRAQAADTEDSENHQGLVIQDSGGLDDAGSFTWGDDQVTDTGFGLKPTPPSLPPILLSGQAFFLSYQQEASPGHLKLLEKIPLVVNNFLIFSIKLLLTQKIYQNEKNYISSRLLNGCYQFSCPRGQ